MTLTEKEHAELEALMVAHSMVESATAKLFAAGEADLAKSAKEFGAKIEHEIQEVQFRRRRRDDPAGGTVG